jgi:surface protein
MFTFEITDNNHTGLQAYITFSAQTGGTYVIGSQTIPYIFESDYPWGTYELYYSQWNQTCTLEYTEPLPFISVWKTTTPNELIYLPLLTGFEYNVDWGDGNVEFLNPPHTTFPPHTYTNPGTYTITCLTIQGRLEITNFTADVNGKGAGTKLREIKQWGCSQISFYQALYQCPNLVLTGVTDTPYLRNNPYAMFQGCTSIGYINNVENWDISRINNLSNFFAGTQFNQDINNWNVSGITNMQGMFFYTPFNQPLSGWNVSNVTRMNSMFNNSSFNQDIGNWNVSKVQDMNSMFNGAPFDKPIGNWTVSACTSMNSMFGNSSFNQDIGNWNVSNVIDMSNMFSYSPFNKSLSGWTTSGVTNMSGMFQGTPFNEPINNWNVSNVIDMSYMFQSASFNQPLSGWNVSNVQDMTAMFDGNNSFNHPLGNWDVQNVYGFSGFMGGKTPLTLSAENLTNIYTGWTCCGKTVQVFLDIDFGTANYTTAGQSGRDDLENNYAWFITDGGPI